MLGEREVFVDAADASLRTSLGAKVRNLHAGSYVASFVIAGERSQTTSVRFPRFMATGEEVEWILPPIPLCLRTGHSIAFRLLLEGRGCVYESVPLTVRQPESKLKHRYVFGKPGNRAVDCILSSAAMLVLAAPYSVLVYFVRRTVVRRFPELAAQRALGKRSGSRGIWLPLSLRSFAMEYCFQTAS